MMGQRLRALLSSRDSDLQRTLADYARRRIDHAERRWAGRYDRWREAERLYRAFRPADLDDQNRSADPLQDGVQKIVVPYGYAVIQSTLAFFMSVFTQRKPIIPVEGMGPSDVRAAILMEHLLDRQMDMMEPSGTLVLYQWLLDALRYGIGIIKNTWSVREFPSLVRNLQPSIDPFSGQPTMDDDLVMRDVTAYEGNEAFNVSPFDFLPDPDVPLSQFQKGEFVVHRMRRSWTWLRQKQAQGVYVGLEHVPRQAASMAGSDSAYGSGRGVSEASRIAGLDETSDAFGADDSGSEPYVELAEMYTYLDPDLWGLRDTGDDGGSSANRRAEMQAATGHQLPTDGVPELWVLTLANNARIVRAEPANLPGRRFPFEAIELNYDVHSPANFGTIETFRGLQYVLSWLFNSRMLNVAKTLNNEYVVDPSMVEEADLLDSAPGRLLRLKQDAWSSGKLRDAVMPLPTLDVTQSHYGDMKQVIDLIQQVSAANSLIMGMPNPGRRAATEVQGQLNLSSGRMKMLTELVAQQGLRPWARQMAMNTQAFLTETGVKVKPPYDRLLGAPWVQVLPHMLQGEFSFPFTEAGMPTDRLFEANTWKELLMMFMQAGAGQVMMQGMGPVLPQMMTAMWGRFLHAMGVKDLQTFGVSLPQLVLSPEDQVLQMLQSGQLNPNGGVLGAGPGGVMPGMGGGPAPNGQAPTDGFALPPAAGTPGLQ